MIPRTSGFGVVVSASFAGHQHHVPAPSVCPHECCRLVLWPSGGRDDYGGRPRLLPVGNWWRTGEMYDYLCVGLDAVLDSLANAGGLAAVHDLCWSLFRSRSTTSFA